MGFFSPKVIDPDIVDWQLEGFTWLIENLSLKIGLEDSELWLPIEDHFGAPAKYQTHTVVKQVFSKICTRCGIDPSTIKLTPVDEMKDGFLGESAIIQTTGPSACGRYFVKANPDGTYREEITYDYSLIDKPTNLIATLAHEVAHALHGRSQTQLDIEPELYELFTDLTAVFFGYGVFLANSRFNFEANSFGWQAQGAGYLPESDLIFATALFMKIKSLDAEIARAHLKPKLFKLLQKSFKQLDKYETEIEGLRQLKPKTLTQSEAVSQLL